MSSQSSSLSLYYSVRNKIRSKIERSRKSALYNKYRNYTMIPRHEYLSNLELVERILPIPGDIVECGTWKGGMIAGIADLLTQPREFYLYDSFQGLPEPKEIDGDRALQWKQLPADQSYDNCTASERDAIEAMSLSQADNVHIYAGWFEDTLRLKPLPNEIALLRLDGDWYESTYTCLSYLFPLVKPGGLIIVDDYYAWDGCAKALHDYLSNHQRLERIMQHNTVCHLIKCDS